MLRIYSYSLVLLESSGVLQRSTLFPTSRDGRNILYDDEYSIVKVCSILRRSCSYLLFLTTTRQVLQVCGENVNNQNSVQHEFRLQTYRPQVVCTRCAKTHRTKQSHRPDSLSYSDPCNQADQSRKREKRASAGKWEWEDE